MTVRSRSGAAVRGWATIGVASAALALGACAPSVRPHDGPDAGGPDAGSGAGSGDASPSDPCSIARLGKSYIGCEYYPTVTGNAVGTAFDFAVAIANASDTDATITIDGGALVAPSTFTVAAGSVAVHTLPWQPALKLCNTPISNACTAATMGQGALVARGAYHLVSSQPVTVYQFNALQYTKDDQLSYSNDASLLQPVPAWGTQYFVAAWQHTVDNGSELIVTAARDGTHVTITPRAASVADGGAPAFAAGASQTVTLDAGGVLELVSRTGDYTGSYVTADQPIQVIGAHYCALVPDGFLFCDHLEEAMLSLDALGTRYLVNAPIVPTINNKPERVRVIATAGNTHLTYDPPRPGFPSQIANPGEFVELPDTAASFVITADHKILVAQYMEGQNAGGDAGDPSMTLAVPLEQFRTNYRFHAPPSYAINYVDVTAPVGARIVLDGTVLDLTAIGATGYGLARKQLPAGDDGNHRIVGDQPFGITVYGYGEQTSYWYPGGLDLHDIIF